MKRKFLPLLAGCLWLAALEGFAANPPTLATHAFMPGATLRSSNTTLISVLGQPFVFELPFSPTSRMIGGILAPDLWPEIPCPAITCPTNPILVTVPCGSNCVPVNYPLPTVVNGVLVECTPPSGFCFPPGTNTVICTATNACGSNVCSFLVHVNPAPPPVSIQCPTNSFVFTVPCGSNCVPVSYPLPTVFNGVLVECIPPSGFCFPPGTNSVICTATNACGSNVCSFLVTVRSNCPPVACVTLRCPTNMIVSCQGSFGATVNYTVEAANQCSPNSLQVQCEPPSGSVFPVGTTRVLCFASGLGESVSCDFTVTVVTDGANCTTNDPVRHAITGRVLTREGSPIRHVQVSLGGAAVQETWTATDGSYGFFNLLPDVAYAVSVAKSNHVFAPTVRQIGSLSNSVVVNFTGTTPFEQWRESRWGSNPPPALAAPTADPDGDRKPNLVEYALGTDPQAFDLDPGFSITMVNGANGPAAELQIRIKPEVTDVQITLEGAANLGDWDAFGRYVPEGLPGSSLLPWFWLGNGDIVPLGGSVRLCLPLGLCITLPPVTEIPRSFWRWSICLLTDCDEGGGIPVEPLPPTNESLRVGTYNVQFLPQLPIPSLTSGCCEGIPDRTFKMAERIAATGVDVIGINEMFVEGGGCESARFLAHLLYGDDYEAVIAALPRPDPRDAGRGPMTFEEWCHKMNLASGRRDLVALMRARNYRHIVAKLDARGSLLQDSGLMLFSKFPFLPLTGSGVDATAAARYFPEPEHLESESPGTPAPYVAFVPFDASVGCAVFGDCPACHGSDCLSNKGAGLVRIRNPHSGRTYLVVFSHFNASDSPGDRRSRAAQFAIIREMIETFRAGRLDEHVIVMGDLNVIGNFDKPEHFPPLAGESCPERGEWWCHFGAGGDYFSATMHDAWEQQMQLAMPEIFNDRRAAGGTSRGGGERLDYVLVNQPESPFENAPLCVQHIAVAHGLAYSDPTLDQGYTPAAFGEAGEVDLSDHFGIIADINLEAPHCSPPTALNAYPRLPIDGTDTATDFPASLLNRGQMYWLSVTNPGTYSFALRGTGRDASGAVDNNFAYQVYRIDDLSRPISGLAGRTRTLNVPGVSNLTAQVFASQDLPLLIRVWHTNRTATGSFTFYARHHLGGSHDDAIEIASPNNPYAARVDFPPGITGAPERWFRFDTDRADSGADQLLHGYASSEDGASVGELLLLAADHATVLDADDVLSATTMLDVRHPYGGGTSLYLLLRPAAPVAGRAFRVGWDTDLTVLSPGTNGCGVGMFLKCIAQNDRPDVLGEDDDDMVLRIFRDSDLDGTRTLIRGPRPLRCEWDTGHEQPVGHIVGTIRFVPGERIVMQLIENDDANFDTCEEIWSRPGSFDLVDTGDGDCEEGKEGCDFEFLEVVIGHLPTSVWRRCGRADADCDPARTPPCAWPYSLGEVRCPDSCTGHYEFHCRVSHGGQ